MEVISTSAGRKRRFSGCCRSCFCQDALVVRGELKPSGITMLWRANRDVLCCCFQGALFFLPFTITMHLNTGSGSSQPLEKVYLCDDAPTGVFLLEDDAKILESNL